MVEKRWIRLNVQGKWLEGSVTDPRHYHWMPLIYNSSVRTPNANGEVDFFLQPNPARKGNVMVAIAASETAVAELSIKFSNGFVVDLHAVQMAMATPAFAVNIDLSGVALVSVRPRPAKEGEYFELDIKYESIEVITVLKTSTP
jgi:hypothetical protein